MKRPTPVLLLQTFNCFPCPFRVSPKEIAVCRFGTAKRNHRRVSTLSAELAYAWVSFGEEELLILEVVHKFSVWITLKDSFRIPRIATPSPEDEGWIGTAILQSAYDGILERNQRN
jgi:hypothetical protein